ncbi:related to Protein involved in sporulation and meiosis [Rhynchosporium secalis]|uniref:Related to Protein involved in sporulation and meiosis n=1 Tax=Rhynchosporium secalis TaxID=38038 RepID=A0A1E1LU94_RHYSE|nr:related to Protein involved in sporulation and meiosis [Rhynchosporium secalis]
MDDKTTSNGVHPSTSFDDSFSSTSPSLSRPLTAPTTYISTIPQPFLPTINRIVNMDSKVSFDAKNAMLSPPEQTPQDSFPRLSSGPSLDFSMKGVNASSNGRVNAPLSPPISPESKTVNPDDRPSNTSRDPILFPQQDSSPTQPPLFLDQERSRMVNEYVQARESSVFREVSPPRHSEYELVLEFKSQVAQAYNANRKLWAQREMAQLREDNMLKMGGRRYTTIAPAQAGGVRQVKPTPRPIKAGSNVRVAKVPRVPKAPQGYRGSTPDMAKRVAREDKDFNALSDYCPPLSTLPNKPNSLKVDWKGAPIDLRSDPHVHLLHPDEVHLAANLRLDCATYLTSKRRIFIQRVEAFKIKKEFRKTDAQQACKIDVNKASKLWSAFDKVGWLDKKYIINHV